MATLDRADHRSTEAEALLLAPVVGQPVCSCPFVRAESDTKTVKPRRSLKLPRLCAEAPRELHEEQDDTSGLVFRTQNGNAHTVRRDSRKILDRAGLVGKEWSPREMRQPGAKA
ncbi:hypothetical protein ACTMTF_49020 [Nonomuraea sp. ZG12]|uniref:hypothetical protein n=1 Tax=Nonomuraea sp. ZG12 TaxID=3452207 RepID=UPI003F89BBF5